MVLSIGDRKYDSALLMPTIHGYPGHAYGQTLAEALRGLYFASQWSARLIMEQPYGYDLRDPSGDASNVQRSRAHGDYFPFARGRRNMPEQTSHVRFIYCYSVIEFHSAVFHARFFITDSAANTDTVDSDMVTEGIVPDGSVGAISQNQQASLLSDYPFTAGYRVYIHEVLLRLVNVSQATPGRCRLTASCYATRENGGSAVAVMPLYGMALAEMHYG